MNNVLRLNLFEPQPEPPRAAYRPDIGAATIGYEDAQFIIPNRTDVHALIDQLQGVARAMAAAGK